MYIYYFFFWFYFSLAKSISYFSCALFIFFSPFEQKRARSVSRRRRRRNSNRVIFDRGARNRAARNRFGAPWTRNRRPRRSVLYINNYYLRHAPGSIGLIRPLPASSPGWIQDPCVRVTLIGYNYIIFNIIFQSYHIHIIILYH